MAGPSGRLHEGASHNAYRLDVCGQRLRLTRQYAERPEPVTLRTCRFPLTTSRTGDFISVHPSNLVGIRAPAEKLNSRSTKQEMRMNMFEITIARIEVILPNERGEDIRLTFQFESRQTSNFPEVLRIRRYRDRQGSPKPITRRFRAALQPVRGLAADRGRASRARKDKRAAWRQGAGVAREQKQLLNWMYAPEISWPRPSISSRS